MSRAFLTRSAAAIALAAAIGGAALAQDATPAASPELPEALSALNLTNIEVETGKRGGTKVEGDLPGGGEIEAMIDPDGNLMMVRSDEAALPQSLIDALLPENLRSNEILPQFAVIEAVGGREGNFMIGGRDSDGEEIRAGFDEDGRLMRFGRGDDDRGERGFGRGEHRGEGRGQGRGEHGGKGRGEHRGEGRGAGGEHGPYGDGEHWKEHRGEMQGQGQGKGPMNGEHGQMRGQGKGPMGGQPGQMQGQGKGPMGGQPGQMQGQGKGPMGGQPGEMRQQGQMQNGMQFRAEEMNKALSDAGYTDLGAPTPLGPVMQVEAVNPAGEPVILDVESDGNIIRESAR